MSKIRPKVVIEKKEYPNDFIGYKWHLLDNTNTSDIIEFDSRITSHVYSTEELARKNFFAVRNLMNKITNIK